jgi:hypothetical protein
MKPFGRRRPQRQSLLCPFGFLAIRFEVFYALAPLLTYMLRMLSEVWFDPKQIVVRPEADRGSTRSSIWFDPKHDSPTATPAWHHGPLEAGDLPFGSLNAGESFAMAAHFRQLYQPFSYDRPTICA